MNTTATALRKLAELAERMTPGEWSRHRLDVNSVTIPNGWVAVHHKCHPDDEFDRDVIEAIQNDATGIAALKNFCTPATLRALAGMVEALEWYREQCAAFNKVVHPSAALSETDTNRICAIVHCLSIDNGQRATAALAALAKETP